MTRAEWLASPVQSPDALYLFAFTADGTPIEGLTPTWLEGGAAITASGPGVYLTSIEAPAGSVVRGTVDLGSGLSVHRYWHITYDRRGFGSLRVEPSTSPTPDE